MDDDDLTRRAKRVTKQLLEAVLEDIKDIEAEGKYHLVRKGFGDGGWVFKSNDPTEEEVEVN